MLRLRSAAPPVRGDSAADWRCCSDACRNSARRSRFEPLVLLSASEEDEGGAAAVSAGSEPECVADMDGDAAGRGRGEEVRRIEGLDDRMQGAS